MAGKFGLIHIIAHIFATIFKIFEIMKKIIVSLVALFVAISAFARPTGLRLGGGYSMDFYGAEKGIDLEELDRADFYGAFLEVGYDWNFTEHSALTVGLRGNLLFNTKFNSQKDIVRKDDYSFSGQISNRFYLDIPVKYQFSFNVSPKVQLFFDLGPTLNFWLGNRTTEFFSAKVGGKSDGDAASANWFKETNGEYYNRVNVSLGADAGVYFNHVKIYLGYDQGLVPFIKKEFGKSALGQLRIGAAYVF